MARAEALLVDVRLARVALVAFQARAEEGFLELANGFFGTESRQHMLAADYVSVWYPRRAEERRAYLAKFETTSPFLLGTAESGAA